MLYVNLEQWIIHPERLNNETLYELRTLVAKYPYAQTLRLLYLKNLYLLHDSTFGEELRKAALYVADRRVLFRLIEGDMLILEPYERQDLNPESDEDLGLDRTLVLIDSFLSKLPEKEQIPAPVELDYATDYSLYLHEWEEQENEKAPKLKGHELIDQFIEGGVDSTEQANGNHILKLDSYDDPSLNDETEEEGFFTETLAKIYIKQKRYSKAIEIIKKLNLKYPKKNAYFADQIRFLEKLIINTKSK
ncbi:MAG: tetratricopeptide repeat protein [Bacteroidales bacterium]|nr:tetratricopeptide repeat protein [Bacteroidales bacterium]